MNWPLHYRMPDISAVIRSYRVHLRNVYSNGTNLYLCERSNICMVDIDLSNANIECFVLIHIDHLERYARRVHKKKCFALPCPDARR